MKAKLRSPYVSIALPDGDSTGGSQMWSDRFAVKRCGCGAVAAYDLVLYLENRDGLTFAYPGSRQEYCRELDKIQKKYFPVLYPNGINGLTLAAGLNRMLHDRHLPYHAFWGVSGKKIFHRIAGMLEKDIPVILAIGPNFPYVWHKNKLKLYQKNGAGKFVRTATVKGHYVTVLELEEDWIRISSWGRSYYLRLSEFSDYVNFHSNYLISNIICVR